MEIDVFLDSMPSTEALERLLGRYGRGPFSADEWQLERDGAVLFLYAMAADECLEGIAEEEIPLTIKGKSAVIELKSLSYPGGTDFARDVARMLADAFPSAVIDEARPSASGER